MFQLNVEPFFHDGLCRRVCYSLHFQKLSSVLWDEQITLYIDFVHKTFNV